MSFNLRNDELFGDVRRFIFKEEQEEYKADGIDVQHIEFVDNQGLRFDSC